MNINKDSLIILKRNCQEYITPYKLTIAILINEFFKFRDTGEAALVSKVYTRDFCILILKLIQNPDLTLAELQEVLTCGRYLIYPKIVQDFVNTLERLNLEGVNFLLNFVNSISNLILKDSNIVSKKPTIQIYKKSVVGYYLRRLVYNFDKLTFLEVTAVMNVYKQYYMIKNKQLNNTKPEIKNRYPNTDQWSRRQAELFITSQAALINNNEGKAFNPKDLGKHIKNVLKSNPDLTEAHFLHYLNYLRVNEFCGAIRSLYYCFDINNYVDLKGNVNETSKGLRFAALNLAVLHFYFGHRDEALAALKEAIMLAQQVNDNSCLQHALSWLYCFTNRNKEKLLEHSILKSLDLNLTYNVSLGIQSFAQYATFNGGIPKYIFETITRSDIVNCQHAYGDLTCNSYTQKSGMWLFYGKTEMSSLLSQLLLRLNPDINPLGTTYLGESLCQAMCNIANHLLMQGEYAMALTILSLARDRFPNEPISHIWLLSENIFTFTKYLYRGEWIEAEIAAQKMAIYDVWESRLRLAELFLQKQDYGIAYKCINEILDNRIESNTKLRIDYHIRALILYAEIRYISNFPNIAPPSALHMCLVYANDSHLDYLGALAYLHLANIQLLMGMPHQALKLLDRCLVHILTHGGNYDRARAMLLYVKCNVANSAHKRLEERKHILLECISVLNSVVENFKKVEAFLRAKDTLFLQAFLYNELNMTKERNKVALDYRLLEEDYPGSENIVPVMFL